MGKDNIIQFIGKKLGDKTLANAKRPKNLNDFKIKNGVSTTLNEEEKKSKEVLKFLRKNKEE